MTLKNPKQSGGPATRAGKLASSQNALKSGAYANSLLFPGEDEAAFQSLQEAFIKDWMPQDATEQELVRKLTSLVWKMRRLERLEQAAVPRLLARKFEFREFSDFPGCSAATANRILEMEDGGIAFQKNLTMAREIVAEGLTDRRLKQIRQAFPELYEELARCALECFEPFLPEAAWCDATVDDEDGRVEGFGQFVMTEYLNEHRELVWVFDHRLEFDAKVRATREDRLMEFVVRLGGQRAHNDLERAFYRALSELRRHRSWVRSFSEITVLPVPDNGPGRAEPGVLPLIG